MRIILCGIILSVNVFRGSVLEDFNGGFSPATRKSVTIPNRGFNKDKRVIGSWNEYILDHYGLCWSKIAGDFIARFFGLQGGL
jgi:hypothetical protein